MRALLRQDKGESVMIGYVLLVVIGISLSVLVFAYLKLYLPKNVPVCEEDVILAIDEASCVNGNLHVKLSNRGLFTVDGLFVRIGEQQRIYKELLNEAQPYFVGNPEGPRLLPGKDWAYDYAFNGAEGIIYELEVQPYLYKDNKAAVCTKAVVTKNIACTSQITPPGGNNETETPDNNETEVKPGEIDQGTNETTGTGDTGGNQEA